MKPLSSARGDRLAIARRAGELTVWDVSKTVLLPLSDADVIKSACGHIGRPLTGRRYAPTCR